jgi:hypothetical protein
MECEYGADVACWAQILLKVPVLKFHSALFTTGTIFFTTGAIKYSAVQCEIPALTLRKIRHGETNIFKILNMKSKKNKPPSRKVPS